MSTSSGTAKSLSSTGGAGLPRQPAFVTTHWSVVIAAGRCDTGIARDAMSRLCRSYWYPLYAYVRRRGYGPEDAQDLTQEFFARLLEQRSVEHATPERGRFRSFLLGAANHFLANERRKARAQKRGGQAVLVPLQLDSAETRYGQEPAGPASPERLFERKWALAVLNQALTRLGAEFDREGKAELFDALKPCLAGDRAAQPYAALAAKLGMSESAMKVAVHRVRRRYRQFLREEVAQTVACAGDVEAELRHLVQVLAS